MTDSGAYVDSPFKPENKMPVRRDIVLIKCKNESHVFSKEYYPALDKFMEINFWAYLPEFVRENR